MNQAAPNPRRWLILAVVGAPFFMTILDVAIVNVPVGALVLALTRPIVPESREEQVQRSFDAAGAVTVTSGLALLVYAISKAPEVGWGSARTILFLLASVAVLAAFVVIELRSR